MQGTVLCGTWDVRFEDVLEPKIIKPTDAIVRLAADKAGAGGDGSWFGR
jgi:hypothetical protein